MDLVKLGGWNGTRHGRRRVNLPALQSQLDLTSHTSCTNAVGVGLSMSEASGFLCAADAPTLMRCIPNHDVAPHLRLVSLATANLSPCQQILQHPFTVPPAFFTNLQDTIVALILYKLSTAKSQAIRVTEGKNSQLNFCQGGDYQHTYFSAEPQTQLSNLPPIRPCPQATLRNPTNSSK